VPPVQKPHDLDLQFEAAAAAGIVDVALAAERQARLPEGLLLALSSRETGCRDVAGDGGHRRGAFGIDDRRDGEWLAGRGLASSGAVPPLDEAARYVAGAIAGNLVFGRANRVRSGDLLRFGVAAYVVGPEVALEGYRDGDVDQATPGGNYGADVLQRLGAAELWLSRRGRAMQWLELEPGARGPAVVELKRLLRAWYGARGDVPPRRMRGPVYGTSAVEAVKEFQRANGLLPDGIVGAETWRALRTGLPGGHASGTAA
jgi:hypothetical protein